MSNEPTDRDSETTLKPCPFCGADGVQLGLVDDEIACNGCGVAVTTYNGSLFTNLAADNIAVWNTRASSAEDERAVLAELLRLKDTLPPLYPTADTNDCMEWRTAWRAVWERAREVLARREKEGKDK